MKTKTRSVLQLLSIAAVAFTVATRADAQSVTPVPAPTIITSAPYTITAGGYYQLGANLSYAGNGAANDAIITINASNVTLDFAGHFISGPLSTPSATVIGVYASERSNLVIENGTIAYCYSGINLVGNGNLSTNFLNPRVLNMTVTRCYQTGIGMLKAVIAEVDHCRISFIGGTTTATNKDGVGISLDLGTGTKVTNCSISSITKEGTGTSYGIYNASVLYDNVIANTSIGAIYGIYRDNFTINVGLPFQNGVDGGGNNSQ